jgi:hypothetical protein
VECMQSERASESSIYGMTVGVFLHFQGMIGRMLDFLYGPEPPIGVYWIGKTQTENAY